MCQFNLDVRKVLDPVHLVHKPWGTLPLFLWHLSVRWPFVYIFIYLYLDKPSRLILLFLTISFKPKLSSDKQEYIYIILYILPFSFLSDLIIRVHTSYLSIFVHHCIFRHVKVDQKVRKFATYIHTQCFQLGFTRTADHLMTTIVYRWVVTHNLWVNLLFCFENILSLSFLHRSTTPWGSFSLSSAS